MTTLIQIFAKAPRLGHVKTRIARDLGDEAALEIHKILCDTTIKKAFSSSADQIEIWTTEEQDEFLEAFGVEVHRQQGKELGTRMNFALRHGLARFDQVLLVGADAYSITSHYLNVALNALSQVDVVIGPAHDGGYVLIGSRKSLPDLFKDIPWGTSDVMGATLATLLNLTVSFEVMQDRWDIDTLADIQKHAPELLVQLRNRALID